MLERLQKKWKVNGLQLTLILCTFAIGGSVTGYAARKLMGLLSIEKGWLWIILYIFLVTIIWPLAVFLISFPFGQYRFFLSYLKKMGRRMGVMSSESRVRSSESGDRLSTNDSQLPTPNYRLPTHIAVFASGAGSNAQKIIDHFRSGSHRDSLLKVALIVCNKPGAGVLKIAEKENIPVVLIEKEKFFHGNAYMDELKKYNIGFIVLAGFLWKIPSSLIQAYQGRIINIHPALLPAHGGKGMYGSKVHEAVIAAGEKESGISIHYVDELYDHGATIFQARCVVTENDTADTLAQRIHQLEHEHYPKVIEKLIKKNYEL